MAEQISLAEYGVEPEYDSIVDNKEALEDLYVRRGKSEYEIAKIANVGSGLVSSRLRMFGEYRDGQLSISEQELRKLYVDEARSITEIANELGASYPTVDRHIRHYELNAELCSDKRKIKQRARDGEAVLFRTWSQHGYEIWEPRSSDCDPASSVLHHRLLAVAEYGFDAVVDKQVHHKNGIPWDNRPENIEPISQRDHIAKHWHPNEVYRSIADAERHELIQALETAGYTSAAKAIKRQTEPLEIGEMDGGASA